MATPEQIRAVQAVGKAIVETVNEIGSVGSPAGVVYAALLSSIPSMTSSQFNNMIDALVRLGKIRRDGVVLYPVAG